MSDDATALTRLRAAHKLRAQRFLTFPHDQVLIDAYEVVRVDALTDAQIEGFRRNGKEYQTVIFLRTGGAVYLNIPFDEVASALQIVEGAAR